MSIDAGSLTILLADYFPCLIFFDENINEKTYNKLDILNYVDAHNNLDLYKMSRNETFNHLFHKEFPNGWDKEKANKNFGCSDVRKHYIYMENSRFWLEFLKLAKVKYAKNIKENNVFELFLDELDYYKTRRIFEDWDFPDLHKSHNLYESFLRYAYRNYCLLGFCLQVLTEKDLESNDFNKLLAKGNEIVLNIFEKNMPNESKAKNEDAKSNWLSSRYLYLQEILETYVKNESPYILKTLEKFTEQLKGGIGAWLKTNKDVNNNDLYSHNERMNINNYMKRIGSVLNKADISAYNKLLQNGIYKDKVIFLYNQINNSAEISKCFKEKQLLYIRGYYDKQLYDKSLDREMPDDSTSTLHDFIEDERHSKHDEIYADREPFLKTFKIEIKDNKKLELFIDSLFDYFKENPPKNLFYGSEHVTEYHVKQIYIIFCELTGDEYDKEIMRTFYTLINYTIDSIIRSGV